MKAPITCRCCRRRGKHRGRGLINACYGRHQRAGTLTQYPLRPEDTHRWRPTGRTGKTMLAKVAELDALGYSPRRISWELGLGMRQVQRYRAELSRQAVASC